MKKKVIYKIFLPTFIFFLDISIPMEYNLTMTTKELQAWRKKNGYSQSQLAKVLDVTSLTISRWERGDRKIPSFLALTLKCLERKGDELKTKGTKMKKERR